MIRRFILAVFAALVAVSAHAQAIDPGARGLAQRALTAAKPGGSVGSVQCAGSNGFVACTSTGSGLVVQATSPTLVTPELGAFTALGGAITTSGTLAGNTAVIYVRQSGSQAQVGLSASGISMASAKAISWGPSTADSSQDTNLVRDAAGVVALRGSIAHSLRVYNTFTDTLNYERGRFGWAGNTLFIGTENLGTGSVRQVTFLVGGSSKWTIDTSGNFVAAADNTNDIGALGATRPRTIYAGTGVISGGVLTWGGALTGPPPSSQGGTSYTVGASDYDLIFTSASTVTVTLPSAAANSGRHLRIKMTGGGAVNSASSNVVPLAGGSAGTAVLSGAAKWAELVSDATNWIVMAAN